MNKQLLLALSLVFGILICFVLFLSLSLKNSKDCSQLVIDTNEIASGIDIPKLEEADCFYQEEEKTRVGIYLIDQGKTNLDGYIYKFDLRPVDTNGENPLWTFTYLEENNAPLPNAQSQLFGKAGQGKNSSWQCLLDKNTGRLWFEIKWTD